MPYKQNPAQITLLISLFCSIPIAFCMRICYNNPAKSQTVIEFVKYKKKVYYEKIYFTNARDSHGLHAGGVRWEKTHAD